MREQFSKLDEKLEMEIKSQAVVALESQAGLSRLQFQSQTLHGEAQEQTRLMGQHQAELIAALASQDQVIKESLHEQDMLATQHHTQATNGLREHHSWIQSTLQDQKELVIRQHGEVLEAFKQTNSSPPTSSDGDMEEYEENVSIFCTLDLLDNYSRSGAVSSFQTESMET